MRDVIETAALALIFGALLRIYRELRAPHEVRCADEDDDMLTLQRSGAPEERVN